MEIAVIVEPVEAGYRARCRHPIEAEATGASRFDATHVLEAALRARVSGPLTLLPVEVTPDKPWLGSAGSVPDDDLTERWLDAIAEYRRERDAEHLAGLPPAANTPTAP